jgi:hypothetical protein
MVAALWAGAAVAALGAIAALALDVLPLAVVLAGVAAGCAVAPRFSARRPAPAPDTNHIVELYQVNSAPGEEEIEHFMYAQCGQEGCEFLEFADPDAADPEASLRSKVAVHSLRQSPVIQIYV